MRFPVLDLSIELTPPSSPNTLANITIRCTKLKEEYEVGVLKDPLSPGDWEMFHWYVEKYWNEFSEYKTEVKFQEKVRQIEAMLPELGKKLYNQVFGHANAIAIKDKWLAQKADIYQLSIKTNLPEVQRLPWELLYNSQKQERDFLALNKSISLVRSPLNERKSTKTKRFQGPLRILFVTARPDNVGFVDPRIIARELFISMQSSIDAGKVVIETLPVATLGNLSRRLASGSEIHVVHFDGHGDYDQQSQTGVLYFEQLDGQSDPVTTEKLAQVLRNTSVRMVVMTSCKSDVGSANDPWSSIAAGLCDSGINTVIGMGALLLVSSASCYAGAFYRKFSKNLSEQPAQMAARQALYTDSQRALQIKSSGCDFQFIRVPLHDWWIPHYYQRCPLALKDTLISSDVTPKLPRMPSEPKEGFKGRFYERWEIERYLIKNKLVIVCGFAGSGKTAIICDVARWLAYTKVYKEVYYFDCKIAGRDVIHQLKSTLQAVESNSLELRSTSLIIIDSLESVLDKGSSLLPMQENLDLWKTIQDLSNAGISMLMAVSGKLIGNEQLWNEGKHVILKGLRPIDAYSLATGILEHEGLKLETSLDDRELRDLLASFDYHPLLIRRILPYKRDYRSFAELKTDIPTLLQRCKIDESRPSDSRSLIDLLRGALTMLGELDEEYLFRLSCFEGGACESNIKEIIGLGNSEWNKWSASLERVGLLVKEEIQSNPTHLFIHFHPVLIPYLRSHQILKAVEKEEYDKWRKKYIQHYYDWTKEYYSKRHYLETDYMLRREIVNIKHMINLLIEETSQEDSSRKALEMCEILFSWLENNKTFTSELNYVEDLLTQLRQGPNYV